MTHCTLTLQRRSDGTHAGTITARLPAGGDITVHIEEWRRIGDGEWTFEADAWLQAYIDRLVEVTRA